MNATGDSGLSVIERLPFTGTLIGIVGHEAAKFTKEGEAKARAVIASLLDPDVVVVSGGCHLGGIDIWAEEMAREVCRVAPLIFRPRNKTWSGGYKPRNLKIAKYSQRVVSIVVNALPEAYTGMRFPYCYHCHRDDHIKSGGCWTGKQAAMQGKPFDVVIINQK